MKNHSSRLLLLLWSTLQNRMYSQLTSGDNFQVSIGAVSNSGKQKINVLMITKSVEIKI